MKTTKQLLWFILPSICVFLLFYVSSLLPQSNSFKFISDQQYIRLLLKDPLFPKSLFYFLFSPFALAFSVGMVLFVFKMIIAKKHNISRFNTYYYTVLFISSSAVFYFSANLKALLGLPLSTYNVHTILSTDASLHFSLPVILVAIQAGIVICFLYWFINKLILKHKS